MNRSLVLLGLACVLGLSLAPDVSSDTVRLTPLGGYTYVDATSTSWATLWGYREPTSTTPGAYVWVDLSRGASGAISAGGARRIFAIFSSHANVRFGEVTSTSSSGYLTNASSYILGE